MSERACAYDECAESSENDSIADELFSDFDSVVESDVSSVSDDSSDDGDDLDDAIDDVALGIYYESLYEPAHPGELTYTSLYGAAYAEDEDDSSEDVGG